MAINKSKFWDEALETAPREVLEANQLKDLQEIVKFAYDNSPYYKRSFDEAGVKPSDIKTLKDIEKFPFINKKTQRDTQGVGSFLGELCAVPEDDVVFISTSSGSTGVPTISPFTQKDFDEFQDTEARWFWQVGVRPNDRYVHALNFSLYVGGPDVIGAQRTGALCIWGGTLPSERLLWVLKTYQPTVIWTSPSYAWQLGEKALKSGIDPKKDLNIKTIIVAGELGGSIDATRKAIEDLWGAQVYDFYGLSDIFGACAAMCEYKDGLHIAEDHILVETVDPNTGKVLPPGEKGEFVFTTLRKHARPLIRFRTGDIGFVGVVLPAVIFVIAGFLSFSTGTAWGTFGILIPIVVIVAQAVDPNSMELTIIALSATLAGSVFGDHCSPISDTTVLSSAGSGCVHIEHVYTQLPYSLTVAVSALIGYAIAGVTRSLPLSLGAAVIVMVLLITFMHKRQLKLAKAQTAD